MAGIEGGAKLTPRPSAFQRLWLPGFAFKAVVIGGGYATGRELVEYFLPSGPRGGLKGMLLAALAWSIVCVLTFLFALATGSRDYRSFFRSLLGKFWPLFDIAYLVCTVLVLSVFGAAAGEIGAAVFGWPRVAGTLCLLLGITLVAGWGNESVERLFKYVTVFLYAVYAVFIALAFTHFGARIAESFASDRTIAPWAVSGLTYAGYNIIGAIVILPVLRHVTTKRDAIIAGALCGPLAMAPAIAFFLCMIAYYPRIGSETLPSNFLLDRMNVPIFHVIFQVMIFAALLESGTATVHGVNERVAAVCRETGRAFSRFARLAFSSGLLVISIFIAARFGLVTLIAKGYRFLAWLLLLVYVAPLLTTGLRRVWRHGSTAGREDSSQRRTD
jgi:uncharacterized membrane protein YkvI